MLKSPCLTRPFLSMVSTFGVLTTIIGASTCTGEDDAKNKRKASGNEPCNSWVYLIGDEGPSGIAEVGKNLKVCGDVRLTSDSHKLLALPGGNVVAALSNLDSRTVDNLVSKQSFGDCLVQLEFLVGRKGNSGVKLQKRYEIQLYDSHDIDKPSSRDCGGIYPHWVRQGIGKPLEYIDEGVPPKLNAAKPAGQWQDLEIRFRAPRFDARGKKIENAAFVSVILNGRLIHDEVELDSPTGNASNPLPEVAHAPILLQIDHGAVAFRNVRVKPLEL